MAQWCHPSGEGTLTQLAALEADPNPEKSMTTHQSPDNVFPLHYVLHGVRETTVQSTLGRFLQRTETLPFSMVYILSNDVLNEYLLFLHFPYVFINSIKSIFNILTRHIEGHGTTVIFPVGC